MLFPDVAPRPATNKSRPHACGLRRFQVVVEPVAHVNYLVGFASGCPYDRTEKRGVWFRRAPIIRRGDHVGRQIELAQDIPGTRGLVTRHPNPYANFAQCGHRGPGVRIQVVLIKRFRLAGFRASHALIGEAEARTEYLERISVIHSLGDHSTEYR